MKTKELIRRLQEADPEGETECNVGGIDIYFVSREPGYYDGAYEVLLRADYLKPFYDIIGVRICRQGSKINLRTVSSSDFLLDHPDGLIQFDSESTRNQYEEKIERIRKENKQIIEEIDAEQKSVLEKKKQEILEKREHRDKALAGMIKDMITKGDYGRSFDFKLPNLPDERSDKANEIFKQILMLLKSIN
jgi:hypothetical protein